MPLAEMLERVEKATGPDRELDGRIWCEIRGYPFIVWDGAGVAYKNPDLRHEDADRIPKVTASADAALALVEREFPGAFWSLTNIDPDSGFDATVGPHHGDGASPALAILAALLSALIAKEASDA